ncbi:MAG: transcriptional regulator [Deltaproteobacteria bacterium]|nr:transcriptional regulator [Deltaproteobacteria bacterium]
MKHRSLKIGIMSLEDYQKRTILIAKGEYKPKPSEPKVFFPSLKAVSQILSEENRHLLKVIRETNPESIMELARTTKRAQSNLSRTLKKLASYGIISLLEENHKKKPVVKYTDFNVNCSIDQKAFATV